MAIKTVTRKGVKLCDVCGSDKNVYDKCCICGKDICFNCRQKEMFMPSSTPCTICYSLNPILGKIRQKYIKKHYALEHKESEEMKRAVKK